MSGIFFHPLIPSGARLSAALKAWAFERPHDRMLSEVERVLSNRTATMIALR